MPLAQCTMVDKGTGQPCQLQFELGAAVRRKVRGVPSNICDPHALPSVKRRTTRTRNFLKQLSQTQPDIDWAPIRRKARTAGKLVEAYEMAIRAGEKPKPGLLRTADDFAVEADKTAHHLLIDTRLAQIQVVLTRDPVVVPIHTSDPKQAVYLNAKQRRLNANRDKIKRSAEQLTRNVEALESGDLKGINWWNTFRDSFAIAVEIYPWVAAYEKGEDSVNDYLQRLANQTKEAATPEKPPEEEEVSGMKRTETEEPAAGATAESVQSPIEAVLTIVGSERIIKPRKTKKAQVKERARAEQIMTDFLRAGGTFFPEDAMSRVEAAADNGGRLGDIPVKRRGQRDRKEDSEAK